MDKGRGGWHNYTGGQNREGKLRVNHGLKCKEEALREFLTVLSEAGVAGDLIFASVVCFLGSLFGFPLTQSLPRENPVLPFPPCLAAPRIGQVGRLG